METESFEAVKEVITGMKGKLDLSEMKEDEKAEFIHNLNSLEQLNAILEGFYQRGLCQFAHHVSVVTYLMLTNQPLLDKVVIQTRDVIAASGDYQIKNSLH